MSASLTLRDGLTEIGPVDVSIGIASFPQHAERQSAAEPRMPHFTGPKSRGAPG